MNREKILSMLDNFELKDILYVVFSTKHVCFDCEFYIDILDESLVHPKVVYYSSIESIKKITGKDYGVVLLKHVCDDCYDEDFTFEVQPTPYKLTCKEILDESMDDFTCIIDETILKMLNK